VGSPCAMLYGNTKCEWESPEAANGLVDTEEWDAGSLTCNFLSGKHSVIRSVPCSVHL